MKELRSKVLEISCKVGELCNFILVYFPPAITTDNGSIPEMNLRGIDGDIFASMARVFTELLLVLDTCAEEIMHRKLERIVLNKLYLNERKYPLKLCNVSKIP